MRSKTKLRKSGKGNKRKKEKTNPNKYQALRDEFWVENTTKKHTKELKYIALNVIVVRCVFLYILK